MNTNQTLWPVDLVMHPDELVFIAQCAFEQGLGLDQFFQASACEALASRKRIRLVPTPLPLVLPAL